MRVREWIKNLVVFAGPVLGYRLLEWSAAAQALLCFLAFCLVASASYAINDVMDRHADAHHPRKCHRPVARGAISPVGGVVFGAVLAAFAFVLTVLFGRWQVAALLVVYFVLILAYSTGLKKKVILDVIIIATGFVLRAWAGAEAVEVFTSPWLIACTFTLCLFMGFGKRRCEVATLGDGEQAREHRKTLAGYTPELLSHLTSVSAGIAVVTFLLYTTTTDDASLHPPFPKEHLLYTLPLVVYGVFRFAMLTQTGAYAGPTDIILKDRPFQATIAVWGVIALIVVFEGRLLGWIGLG
jgi:4-hydroxybenzoate polyprenyltransferase